MAQQQVNEYDALNFEGMERRANYRVIAFREDIYHALGRDRAKATVFHIIYRWQEYLRDQVIAKNTDRVKLGKPLFTDEEVYEQMWVKMSPYDFSRETGGSISHSTMRIAAQALVKDGVLTVKQTGCQEDGNLAYHYQINKKAIAEKLDAIPVYPPKVTRAKSGTGTDAPTNPDTPRTKRGTGYTKSGTDPVLNAARTPYQSGYAPRTNSGTHYSNNSSDSENRDITASFLGERESSPDPVEQSALPEKKEDSSIAYSQDIPTPTTDSSRLQENKAHQSTQTSLFQESVPAEKSAAPKLPDMTRDVLQRENRPPTPAEQKRIDDKERRERAQQVRKRTEELWLLFDRLFKSRVNRYGYNKPQVEELALNDLATDEIIEKAFEAVAKSDAVKKDPTRLSITNIAIAVPSFIRVEQIKVVESSKPKEETEVERIYRKRREILAREKQKEMAQ